MDFEISAKTEKKESKRRSTFYTDALKDLMEKISPELEKAIEIAMEKGPYHSPTCEKDIHLSKREFWDAISIRYAWPLTRLPSKCACGDHFDLEHALSCMKGGFIVQRHNEIRDLTDDLLAEVCKDLAIEPMLESLSGETFRYKSSKSSDEARLDVIARGFWLRVQRAFFM